MSDTTQEPPAGPSVGHREPMRVGRVLLLIAIASFAGWLMLGAPGYDAGFTEADIETTKASIKTEFEKRPGVKVTEVFLMKRSANELTGFVKMTAKVLDQDIDLIKNCTATRGTDDRSMWSCS